jgi:hypothetical protein
MCGDIGLFFPHTETDELACARSWIVSKAVPSRSRTRETLQFLLDHPRRCFIYLFPS